MLDELPTHGPLSADAVSVERAGRLVLSDLSLIVAPGEALVVEGPNGSGKSTLLRALARLLPVFAGAVTHAGAPVVPANIHYVGHANALKTPHTVLENARFWTRFWGGDPADIDDALETFGLLQLEDVHAEMLSQGQRRRLALVRLLAVQRPIWLLDEPTAGLDAASRKTLASVMERHLAAGGIIVAATHEPLGLSVATPFQLEAAWD